MLNLYRYIAYALIVFMLTACGSAQPAEAATKAQSISFLLSQVRASGVALSGGKVDFYEAGGTTTRKTVWLDRNKATAAANPYTLDSNGTAQLYGDGLYRIVIKDSAGVTKYDRDYISIKEVAGNVYDVADYASLAAAVASIGSTPATLQFASDVTVSANLTIPSTLELIPLNGAKINHTTYTISYAGSTTRWPISQVFNGTGAVTGLKESRPEYFGAVGNGVADDYADVLASINAASGTGSVILRKGAIYASSTRIAIPSGINITGGGTLKALPLGTSASVQGFLYGDALSNVTIDGIKIDCDPANQTHPLLAAVYMTGSSNIRFVNSEVVCSYSGVYIRAGSSKVMVAHNVIDNSYGSSTDAALQHGASIIVGANDSFILGNKVTGIISTEATDSNIATGIYAGSDTGTTYTNITVSGNSVNYSYTAYSAMYVNNLVLSGNSASNCRTKNHSQGILLTECNGASVVGNTLRNIDFTGISLMDCKNSTVSANIVSNDADFLIGTNIDSNRANGITVSQTVEGGSGNNTVTGNSIVVGGSHASASYIGLLVYGNGSTVSGNTVSALSVTTSTGLQFTGENFTVYGNTVKVSYIGLRVLLVAGWTDTKNNAISNNVIYSSGTYAIYDVSIGPNRYIANTVLLGATTFSYTHYVTNSDMSVVSQNKTANYTVEVKDNAKLFTNIGAAGTIVLTLPTAATGLTYRFTRVASQAFRIAPTPTNAIRGGGNGKYLEITSVGTVELTCLASGSWEITSQNCTSAFEP